jgi:hypothetical protein
MFTVDPFGEIVKSALRMSPFSSPLAEPALSAEGVSAEIVRTTEVGAFGESLHATRPKTIAVAMIV